MQEGVVFLRANNSMKKKKQELTKKQIQKIISSLIKDYPNAKAELNFTNPFELLIATMLSAQCTDVRVNKTTPELFKILGSPEDINSIKHSDLEGIIKSCGLYKSKAKNIRLTCEILNSEYGGEVPKERDTLVKLPGVGRKTANVVVSNAFGTPAIAVDTHVKRVSNRIGLVKSDNVKKIEEELMKKVPRELWTKMHHVLIFHGRRICKARNPLCESCSINEDCLYYKVGRG